MSQHSRHNDPGSAGVNLGLIITPMLDMSFQILSFFIMTYNPSILEGHIDGTLVPPTKALVKGTKENVKTESTLIPDSEPVIETTLQVIVAAVPKGAAKEGTRTDGEPTEIYFKRPEDNEKTFITGSDKTLDESMVALKSKLTDLRGGAGVKNSIRLDCSGDLKHQYVMRVYDVCKESGFPNVSFVAPAPEKAPGSEKDPLAP